MIARPQGLPVAGRPASRQGFSLVEILIVIGVIGLLMTIMVFAIGPALESARINSTRVTINQINDIIQQRAQAVANADLSAEANRLATVTGMNVKQAEFILRKNLYRRALPQSYADFSAISTADIPPGVTPATPPEEVFFLAITTLGKTRAVPGQKEILLPVLDVDTINRRHVRDNRFVDEWDNPLYFYNWPTRLVRPSGFTGSPSVITQMQRQVASTLIGSLPPASGDLLSTELTHALNQDIADPTGRYSGFFFSLGSPITVVPLGVTIQPFHEADWHTINTYYTPLLISAGPDGVFGLHPPNASGADRLCQPLDVAGSNWTGATEISTEIFDNITNRQSP